MGNDFSAYLIYIVLVGGSLLALMFLILKKIQRGNAEKSKPELIENGNVGVFFDQDENVIIIPYAKDKYGVGRAVASPVILNKPYSTEKLGQTIRHSMKLCRDGKECSDNELMAVLKFPGWKEFSEGKRNISVHYQEGHGVVFNTTRRRIDGSYQFNFFGFEHVVPNDIINKQLGEVILTLLSRCRA